MLPWLLFGGLVLWALSQKSGVAQGPPAAQLPAPSNPYLGGGGGTIASGDQSYTLGSGSPQAPLGGGLGDYVGPSSNPFNQYGPGGDPFAWPPQWTTNVQTSGPGILTPNGIIPGTPAAMTGRGTVVCHTGCSCARTGAPIVSDGRRAFLMVPAELW